MKICPYCGQDHIRKVRLESQPLLEFRMCFECDTVWLKSEEISDTCGVNFAGLMESNGIVPNWKDIIEIGYED